MLEPLRNTLRFWTISGVSEQDAVVSDQGLIQGQDRKRRDIDASDHAISIDCFLNCRFRL